MLLECSAIRPASRREGRTSPLHVHENAAHCSALLAIGRRLMDSEPIALGSVQLSPSGPTLSLHFKRVVGHERSARDGSLQVT
eukprot:4653022-Prymnesium_polylepis.1